MNEYMENAIVTHAWHEFVYGYNTEDRKKFLERMVDDYPIKFDNDQPVVTYVDDFMLPIVKQPMNPERFRVQAVAREYLSFTLVSAIIEQSIKQIEMDELNQRLTKFISSVNRLYISSEDMEVKDICALRDALLISKEFYKEQYVKLMETGFFQGDISTLPITFMELSMFINSYKKSIGMNRHFAIVLDYPGTGAVVSQQAVNGLVTRRIAGDLAMKVVCQPEEWRNFYDFGGQLAESVHDYSVVELDDSYKKYMKKIMKSSTF